MEQYESIDQVTVGVIGYGGAYNMGRTHLENMQKVGMVPLAVTEIDEARLDIAKTDFPGIETYTQLDEMLAKSSVNLIVIITPHNTHFELAEKCLKAGKHVVCEKPLAITTEECDRMIELAEENGVILSTFHNRHWDPFIVEAVERVNEEKVVGEVYRIDARMGGYSCPGDWWRTSRSISGGILYDWGVHILEYALQIIDDEVTEVSGFAKEGFWEEKTKWKGDCNEDVANIVVRFKRGARLNILISNLDSHMKSGFFEIVGTEGTYFFDNPGATNYTVIKGGNDDRSTVVAKHPETDPAHCYYQNIAGYLLGKEKLVVTG